MRNEGDSALEGDVTVHGSGSALVRTIQARSHRIAADEPVALGGNDAGPTPYDLVLAALGSCASITVTLYARRKGWSLEEVTVRLRHSRVHAVDCAECDTKEGHIDRIDWWFQFGGEVNADQRTRLLDIAQRCPVHRMLTSEVDIRPPKI